MNQQLIVSQRQLLGEIYDIEEFLESTKKINYGAY